MNFNFRLLRADEIEARIARITKTGVSVLLYKDARCDMKILDETVGAENWQRSHEVINNNLFCNVGIFNGREWVWKQDVGTESNTEAEKGEASDSFKRACFNWGIGRELYTSPRIFFKKEQCNIDDQGKCYDFFDVEEIEYTDRKVSWLKVVNTKTKGVYVWGKSRKLNEYNKDDHLTQEQAEELHKYMVAADINETKLMEKYEVEQLSDLTMTQFEAIRNKASRHIVETSIKGVEE